MAATRNKRSTDPVDAVAACLMPRLSRGGRVCVALSGGRDSVALLHALVALRDAGHLALTLSALHVHHGISRSADDWAAFCADLCARLQVPFRCERVTVDLDHPIGIEAAARAARYRVFTTCEADWLLLAHHRDDQAETLLLNLLRGSGVHGLAGMPEARALAGGPWLLRPFLGIRRQAIEAWLATRCLSWVEDDSNEDIDLRRNFLRHQVLPLIGSQFPEPSLPLARAAGHLAEMAALADEVASADAQGVVTGRSLDLAPFNMLPRARRTNLLRLFFRQHGLRAPDSRHVAEILRQLSVAQPSAAPAFRVDSVMCRVSRGRLWVCTDHSEAPLLPVPWTGASEVPWAGGTVSFRSSLGEGVTQRLLQAAANRVELRPRYGGERLRTDPQRVRRQLKKILQETGVPQWQRDRMPLLWCGEVLVWAAGVGYSADTEWLAAPGEPGWLLSWSISPNLSDG